MSCTKVVVRIIPPVCGLGFPDVLSVCWVGYLLLCGLCRWYLSGQCPVRSLQFSCQDEEIQLALWFGELDEEFHHPTNVLIPRFRSQLSSFPYWDPFVYFAFDVATGDVTQGCWPDEWRFPTIASSLATSYARIRVSLFRSAYWCRN